MLESVRMAYFCSAGQRASWVLSGRSGAPKDVGCSCCAMRWRCCAKPIRSCGCRGRPCVVRGAGPAAAQGPSRPPAGDAGRRAALQSQCSRDGCQGRRSAWAHSSRSGSPVRPAPRQSRFTACRGASSRMLSNSPPGWLEWLYGPSYFTFRVGLAIGVGATALLMAIHGPSVVVVAHGGRVRATHGQRRRTVRARLPSAPRRFVLEAGFAYRCHPRRYSCRMPPSRSRHRTFRSTISVPLVIGSAAGSSGAHGSSSPVRHTPPQRSIAAVIRGMQTR